MWPHYYTVLGVLPAATQAEIKTGYRKAAKNSHPDRNPDKDTKAEFALVAEAYAVLSDPAQRAEYDRPKLTLSSSVIDFGELRASDPAKTIRVTLCNDGGPLDPDKDEIVPPLDGQFWTVISKAFAERDKRNEDERSLYEFAFTSNIYADDAIGRHSEVAQFLLVRDEKSCVTEIEVVIVVLGEAKAGSADSSADPAATDIDRKTPSSAIPAKTSPSPPIVSSKSVRRIIRIAVVIIVLTTLGIVLWPSKDAAESEATAFNENVIMKIQNDVLLQESSAILALYGCQWNKADLDALKQAIGMRQHYLNLFASTDLSHLPSANQMKEALKYSFESAIKADRTATAWGHDNEVSVAHGRGPICNANYDFGAYVSPDKDPNYSTFISYCKEAETSAQTFINFWDPISKQYNLPQIYEGFLAIEIEDYQ